MSKQYKVIPYQRSDLVALIALLVHERFSFSYRSYDVGGLEVTVPERPITEERFEKILRLFGAQATYGEIDSILPSKKINLSRVEVQQQEPIKK